MKRLLTLAALALIAVALPLALVSCGSDDDAPDPDNPTPPATTPGSMLATAGHITGSDGADYLLKTVKENRSINAHGSATDQPEISLAYSDPDANGFRSLATLWYEDVAKNNITVINLKPTNYFVDVSDNNGNYLYEGHYFNPTFQWNAQGLFSRMTFTKTEPDGTKVAHDIVATYSGQHLRKFTVGTSLEGSADTDTHTYELTWSGNDLTAVAYTHSFLKDGREGEEQTVSYQVISEYASEANPAAQWEPQALFGFETLQDLGLDYMRSFFYAGLMGKGSGSVPYGWTRTVGSAVSQELIRGGSSLTGFGTLSRAGSSSPSYSASFIYVFGGTAEWADTGVAPATAKVTARYHFCDDALDFLLPQELSDELMAKIPTTNNAFYAELVELMDEPLRLRFESTDDYTMKPVLMMHIGQGAKDDPMFKPLDLANKYVTVSPAYVDKAIRAINLKVNGTAGDPTCGHITYSYNGQNYAFQFSHLGGLGVYIKKVEPANVYERNDLNPAGWTYVKRLGHSYAFNISTQLAAYYNGN